jgi:hypothetical protein
MTTADAMPQGWTVDTLIAWQESHLVMGTGISRIEQRREGR